MQVFLQYSVFSGLCAKCTKWQGRFSTSFRDLTLDISKVRDYNGHIKNEGGARDEAFCHGSDESVEPYRCCCVRTGLLLCLQSIRNPQHLPGRCHCVHFCRGQNADSRIWCDLFAAGARNERDPFVTFSGTESVNPEWPKAALQFIPTPTNKASPCCCLACHIERP